MLYADVVCGCCMRMLYADVVCGCCMRMLYADVSDAAVEVKAFDYCGKDGVILLALMAKRKRNCIAVPVVIPLANMRKDRWSCTVTAFLAAPAPIAMT
jgi:hypothetical protein